MVIEVGENDDFTLVADGDPDIDIAIAGVTLDHLDSQRAILDISDPIYAEYVLRLSYSGTSLESSEAVPLGTIMGFPVENNAPEPIIFDIPGTIDAELYTVNNGMNLETCYDVGGGNNLSEIDVGDWVEYMIDVEKTGYYIGFIRTSGAGGVGQLTIQSPDAEVVDLDTVTLPITGNWQTWASTPVEIILYEGEQRLRLYANTNGYNINWLSLEFEKDLDVARPLQGQKIMVYPNPVSDRLYINAGGAGICSLEIINISGKKVMYREYDASPSQLTLDLDISEGLYLMKLNTGSQIMVTRLIVE